MVPKNNLPYVFLRVAEPEGRGPRRRAQLVGHTAVGLDLKSTAPVKLGSHLVVWGKLFGTKIIGKPERHVVAKSCEHIDDHSYKICCSYSDAGAKESQDSASNAPQEPRQHSTDYYEVLQISPHADTETIHRVYRFMAQRYHPDNVDTGNSERFTEILEAYRLLSDPEKRAAHDVQRRSSRQTLQETVGLDLPGEGPAAEPAKRQAILKLFYLKMLRSPTQPGTMVRELEEILQIPEPHLEFTLWFLRQKRWIVLADGGRLAITIDGVEEVERLGILGGESDQGRIEANPSEKSA